MRLVFAALIPLALLAGCKKSDKDERKASGQVLEGTISDAMLPLDTVTSLPPLAKSTGTAGEPDAEATDDVEDDEAALEAEESPAAEDNER